MMALDSPLKVPVSETTELAKENSLLWKDLYDAIKDQRRSLEVKIKEIADTKSKLEESEIDTVAKTNRLEENQKGQSEQIKSLENQLSHTEKEVSRMVEEHERTINQYDNIIFKKEEDLETLSQKLQNTEKQFVFERFGFLASNEQQMKEMKEKLREKETELQEQISLFANVKKEISVIDDRTKNDDMNEYMEEEKSQDEIEIAKESCLNESQQENEKGEENQQEQQQQQQQQILEMHSELEMEKDNLFNELERTREELSLLKESYQVLTKERETLEKKYEDQINALKEELKQQLQQLQQQQQQQQQQLERQQGENLLDTTPNQPNDPVNVAVDDAEENSRFGIPTEQLVLAAAVNSVETNDNPLAKETIQEMSILKEQRDRLLHEKETLVETLEQQYQEYADERQKEVEKEFAVLKKILTRENSQVREKFEKELDQAYEKIDELQDFIEQQRKESQFYKSQLLLNIKNNNHGANGVSKGKGKEKGKKEGEKKVEKLIEDYEQHSQQEQQEQHYQQQYQQPHTKEGQELGKSQEDVDVISSVHSSNSVPISDPAIAAEAVDLDTTNDFINDYINNELLNDHEKAKTEPIENELEVCRQQLSLKDAELENFKQKNKHLETIIREQNATRLARLEYLDSLPPSLSLSTSSQPSSPSKLSPNKSAFAQIPTLDDGSLESCGERKQQDLVNERSLIPVKGNEKNLQSQKSDKSRELQRNIDESLLLLESVKTPQKETKKTVLTELDWKSENAAQKDKIQKLELDLVHLQEHNAEIRQGWVAMKETMKNNLTYIGEVEKENAYLTGELMELKGEDMKPGTRKSALDKKFKKMEETGNLNRSKSENCVQN